MLTAAQEKLIKSLATKKGRTESGLCLVEGQKNVKEAAKFIDFMFTPADSRHFDKLINTVTPQPIAAVTRIPVFTESDILKRNIIVVLDGVQDPGNVGTILRLCLGFDASLILIESADPSAPKVLRASAGAVFHVPWLCMPRLGAQGRLAALGLPVIRLEAHKGKRSATASSKYISKLPSKFLLMAGSEGQGITLNIPGTSLSIPHNQKLESLNVAQAVAIILAQIYNKT